MQPVSGNRIYAVIGVATSLTRGHINFGFMHNEGDPEPVPEVGAGSIVVALSDEVLAGDTPDEFLAKKKAVLSGGAFSSWADRAAAPSLALLNGVSPSDDGVTIATINISGGPASSTFLVGGLYTGMKTDLTDNAGVLDGSGAGTFRVKALGGGGSAAMLKVLPDGHQDFLEGSLEVPIEKTSF